MEMLNICTFAMGNSIIVLGRFLTQKFGSRNGFTNISRIGHLDDYR